MFQRRPAMCNQKPPKVQKPNIQVYRSNLECVHRMIATPPKSPPSYTLWCYTKVKVRKSQFHKSHLPVARHSLPCFPLTKVIPSTCHCHFPRPRNRVSVWRSARHWVEHRKTWHLKRGRWMASLCGVHAEQFIPGHMPKKLDSARQHKSCNISKPKSIASKRFKNFQWTHPFIQILDLSELGSYKDHWGSPPPWFANSRYSKHPTLYKPDKAV